MNGVVKSTCGLCQNGCGVLVHVTNGRVTKVDGDPDSPVNRGKLCAKGLASLEYLYHPDRLKYPLKRMGERGKDRWQQISWDEALGIVSDELIKAKDNFGPESVAFIQGAEKGFPDRFGERLANAFGTPNFSTTGHVCFLPRLLASQVTCGFYPIPDYDYPPACIMVWGSNMAATRIGEYEKTIQALGKGTKLIVIDPRRIDIATKAHIWLQLRPGSDLVLALGMINVIINEKLFDRAFVDNWVTGFDELKNHVQKYAPKKVEEITWVPAESIRETARFYSINKPACIQWGNAIDHGINSFQTARAISILRAITGNCGIPGGDLQCSSPIGATKQAPSELVLRDKMPVEKWEKRVGADYRLVPPFRRVLPQSLIKAIVKGVPYPIHAMFVQASNPMITYSNAQEAYKALNKLDFLAAADLFMTPTAALADIVLPAATYLEFDNIVSPPYYPIAQVQQKVTEIGDCRSDFEIIAGLAKKLGLQDDFWGTTEEFLDAVLKPVGLSFSEFRNVGVIVGKKQYRCYEVDGLDTPSGKVELYSSQLKDWGLDPLPIYHEPPETPYSDPELSREYPLIYTSWKSEPYRHSEGRQIAPLRNSHPDPTLVVHPETADRLGIQEGDWVYIETKRGRIKQKATLIEGIDPRVVGIDYAWWFPEKGVSGLYGWTESNTNILTDDKPPFNRETGSANLRAILCKVYKA
ncbi:MAG: molybdopterin-dependent oxidoreductase [Deltaproteobacteria bacterium]|nr:molybdopterin-dependent oxidoreductase [Deltaproteobacteria bacterium]